MSRWVERLFYPERPESVLRELVLSPLAVAEACFAAGVQARAGAWARGWIRAERVPGLRVVSVGNVLVGGAGKTPVVRALAER
ncbi:MAG: tetraacyldisaccharide 4'-kinase, partial [Myxococcaceae bacterium]